MKLTAAYANARIKIPESRSRVPGATQNDAIRITIKRAN